MMKENNINIGIFAGQEQAQQAIAALEDAGFDEDRIGYVAPGGSDLTGEVTDGTPDLSAIIAGAGGGGTLGGLIGVGMVLLIPGYGPILAGGLLLNAIAGAILGSVAGGLVGAFMSVGVPEEEARYYQRELEKGHPLVIVKGTSQIRRALLILQQYGAINAEARPSRPAIDAQ